MVQRVNSMSKLGVYIDKTRGEVRLAVKQGKPEKPKRSDYDRQQELIQICLNCTRKRCGGCARDKRFKKQRLLTKEELL